MVAFGTSIPSLNIGFQDAIFFARLAFVSPSGRGERLSRFLFSDQAGRWYWDEDDDPALSALHRDGMELVTSEKAIHLKKARFLGPRFGWSCETKL